MLLQYKEWDPGAFGPSLCCPYFARFWSGTPSDYPERQTAVTYGALVLDVQIAPESPGFMGSAQKRLPGRKPLASSKNGCTLISVSFTLEEIKHHASGQSNQLSG